MNLLARKPWLLVVAAFAALIAGWVLTLRIAERHRPVPIPVQVPARP
jgi:hypothetical protein